LQSLESADRTLVFASVSQQQGMTGKRVTATTAALLVASALGAAPAVAAQGPLLSGYGGPGEGEQAILGSALLGGPKGGGGGSAAGGGSGGSGSSSQASQQPTSEPNGSAALTAPAHGTSGRSSAGGAPATHTGSGGSTTRAVHNGVATAPKRVAEPSGGAGAADRAVPGPQLVSADSSQPLGISNTDFVYMLLALAALVLTGALTLQLARRPH
jgi:hypothetical protein